MDSGNNKPALFACVGMGAQQTWKLAPATLLSPALSWRWRSAATAVSGDPAELTVAFLGKDEQEEAAIGG